MICDGCQNEKAYLLQISYKKEGRVVICNKCGATGGGVPDVYFKQPYWDENISSEEHPGAKFISSRSEKKYWLEKCNLREAGDRVHGASGFDKISHRHAVESLHKKGYRS